jgi:hypothetical protein
MGNSKAGVTQGSILGPFLFLICISNLLPTINTLQEAILFTGDTSVIISSKKCDDLSTITNIVLSHMSKWFTSNKLVLNLHNTNIITFITNNSP